MNNELIFSWVLMEQMFQGCSDNCFTKLHCSFQETSWKIIRKENVTLMSIGLYSAKKTLILVAEDI